MAKVSKDIPLAEITLRKYEKPYGERRDLIKKLCLSIGLLQPGDSRDVIVDVFQVLLDEKKEMDSTLIVKNVIDLRNKAKLPLVGVAPSNVRRQLRRLRDLYLIEKVKNNYRVTEKDDLLSIFEERIEKFYLKSIVSRVKEYFDALK
jgi:hypothetical protein